MLDEMPKTKCFKICHYFWSTQTHEQFNFSNEFPDGEKNIPGFSHAKIKVNFDALR